MHKMNQPLYLPLLRTLSNGAGDVNPEEYRQMTEKYSLVVKENSALTLALCACQVRQYCNLSLEEHLNLLTKEIGVCQSS